MNNEWDHMNLHCVGKALKGMPFLTISQSVLMQTNPTTTTTASFLLIFLVATPAFSQAGNVEKSRVFTVSLKVIHICRWNEHCADAILGQQAVWRLKPFYHLVTPQRNMFNRRRLSFASLPIG